MRNFIMMTLILGVFTQAEAVDATLTLYACKEGKGINSIDRLVDTLPVKGSDVVLLEEGRYEVQAKLTELKNIVSISVEVIDNFTGQGDFISVSLKEGAEFSVNNFQTCERAGENYPQLGLTVK